LLLSLLIMILVFNVICYLSLSVNNQLFSFSEILSVLDTIIHYAREE